MPDAQSREHMEMPRPQDAVEQPHLGDGSINVPETLETDSPEVASAPDVKTAIETPTVDPVYARIDTLLASGLRDEYSALSLQERAQFKLRGEALGAELHTQMLNGPLDATAVLKKVHAWLSTLSSPRREWITRTAEIKTREILRFAEERANGAV